MTDIREMATAYIVDLDSRVSIDTHIVELLSDELPMFGADVAQSVRAETLAQVEQLIEKARAENEADSSPGFGCLKDGCFVDLLNAVDDLRETAGQETT